MSEQYALMITSAVETWVEGPYTEDEAMSRRTRLWDSGSYTIQMCHYEGRDDSTDVG
jgi:hypothetical protein